MILILNFTSVSLLSAKDYSAKSSSKFNLHSINFVQNTIDVSKSDKTFFFSLRGSSPLGLNKVTIYFESPSGTRTIQTSCENKKKSKIGMILGRVLFKKKSEGGVWNIKQIVMEDLQGNRQVYNKEFLQNNNFTHSLTIKGNRQRR